MTTKAKNTAKARDITFDAALAAFVRSIGTAQEMALVCSTMAIKHYAEHGQMGLLQKFLDAMPQNFTRKQAFVMWVVAHTPLKLSQGKFETDRSAKANKLNLEGALKEPFWDYAPEKETKNYSAADVFKAVTRPFARWRTRTPCPSMTALGGLVEKAKM
jgi:hypothetical protein